MKTVLIICEYNPFHSGHKYQITDIRKTFGEDTKIIALMSGNFTQRGEIAIADKFLRAKCAVLEGVNLVLQLPFPFSSASAEFFAKAGVEIANSLGIVDVLAFGSECGDIKSLTSVARNMLKEEYKTEVQALKKDEKNKTLGYPKICEAAYRRLYGEHLSSIISKPNNILAIEYIKALILTDSSIIPYTTKRSGASFSAKKIEKSAHQSATAIRELLTSDTHSALEYIPLSSKEHFLSAYKSKEIPSNQDRLSAAVLSYFSLNSPLQRYDIHDADGGLYNRLITLSNKATSIAHLTQLASTKKYTDSRIRRAIWFSFFGVTSSDVRATPEYTQVLAMDSCGQAMLKLIKKTSAIAVITKPSATPKSESGKIQKELSDKADFLFEFSKPIAKSGDTPLKTSPFVKKD